MREKLKKLQGFLPWITVFLFIIVGVLVGDLINTKIGNMFSYITMGLGDGSYTSYAPLPTAFVLPTVAQQEPEESRPLLDNSESNALLTMGTPISTIPKNDSSSDLSQRLIIKNGQMEMLSNDPDQTIASIIQIASNVGGYMIASRVWSGNDGYRYGEMTIGVPILQFESVMANIRTLGVIKQELVTGEDVSEEFVDLESRLANLRITQERLQTFLSAATKLSDVVALNQELSGVEEELALIQGRMRFLEDRAAFSLISVNLFPVLPTPTPSLTPTMVPTPTPTPLPTADTWQPGNTARVAATNLQNTAQTVGDSLIYNSIICGPWLLVLGLVGFGLWKLRRFLKK